MSDYANVVSRWCYSHFLDRKCAAPPSVDVFPPDFDRPLRTEPRHG